MLDILIHLLFTFLCVSGLILEVILIINRNKKDGSKYTLDLGELGYNKLLSKGEISEKMEIKVSKYSDIGG